MTPVTFRAPIRRIDTMYDKMKLLKTLLEHDKVLALIQIDRFKLLLHTSIDRVKYPLNIYRHLWKRN